MNYDDTLSDQETITCGVPQDSILGPLLFLIYMNDVANSSAVAHFILFADDTSLFFEAISHQEIETKMNRELQNIANWMSANKLSLNIAKTKFMVFSTNPYLNEVKLKFEDHNIEQIEHFKFLGTWLDPKLNWKYNTNEKCKKISQSLAVMHRIKHKIPSEILRLICNSLIQPHLAMGILTWYSNSYGAEGKIQCPH